MSEQGPSSAPVPEIDVRKRRGISIVWLIPLVAAAVAGWLAYTTLSQKGPTITISFKTAAGLEAGKTKVKYKDVGVGLVETIVITEDLSHIVVSASLDKSMERHLTEGTRFWVVRPRLGVGGVSGLDTLVSGAYIEIDPGTGEALRDFEGLEIPPVVRSDEPGREFVLVTEKLGSLAAGSPIYFRGIEVGEVLGYKLNEDDRDLEIEGFVRAPYDQLVRANSRFWNASGIDITMDADGLKVSTESLQVLLAGGVAFDTPASGAEEGAAAAGTRFTLYDNFASIREQSFLRRTPVVMFFDGSVRGLSVGAPVEFRGIKVGKVTDVRIEFDKGTSNIRIPVTAEIEPERATALSGRFEDPYKGLDLLVERGLRAQLISGSLVTGQLLVGLDFHADSPPARLDYSGIHPAIPTVPSKVEEITASITSILAQVGSLPLDELFQDLRTTIQSANRLVGSPDMLNAVESLNRSLKQMEQLITKLDGQITPLMASLIAASGEARDALKQANSTLVSAERFVGEDSQLSYGLNELLNGLTDAARSIRVLVDYLEAHPEALIQGKGGASSP